MIKLLHVIPSLDPRGGGPMEGVRSLSSEITDHGAEIEVVTLDAPTDEFVLSFPAKVHALGPSIGSYRYNSRIVPWLRKHAGLYDAVIVNGLWQCHGFAVWRALAGTSTPYFVFTHGMLDPWFKREYPLKHIKKWLYWPWAEYRLLRDAKAVIFTCEEERVLARKSFWLYRANEEVTSYGAAEVPAGAHLTERFFEVFPALRGKRLMLFLSRIHEKKGCDLLIEAFARVSNDHPDLHLVMAGPDQTGWMSTLKALADARGVSGRVTWTGMLSGDLKWGAFGAAEVFCLPSHQENFGIVVAEALACERPVLISDKVNIWREVEADRAGIVSGDTIDGVFRAVKQWLDMTPADKAEMRTRARASFEKRFHMNRVASDLVRILRRNGVGNSRELEAPEVLV